MGRLEGKVAIITGGASGIGRASAKMFAAEGARVAVGDLDEPGGFETLRQIEAQGGESLFVQTDVSSASDAQRLVQVTVARWGALHVLYNNAYWAPTGRNVLNTTEDEWDRTQAVTLKSMYLMSRQAIPEMLKGGQGSIVNMASVAGIVGSKMFSAYAAAKGGVISLTRSMAIDFGKQGIRVNCIAPGPIDTPAIAELKKDPKWLEFQMGRLLLDHLGRPEDIAYAAVYLASDESTYVTGSVMLIDGGATSN
jgi:NAD(P)-dependent dehydrogenase (short-subunit alcohol dehydrogenase family)